VPTRSHTRCLHPLDAVEKRRHFLTWSTLLFCLC